MLNGQDKYDIFPNSEPALVRSKMEFDLLDKMNLLFKNIKWWLRWMIFPIHCLGLNKRDFVTD